MGTPAGRLRTINLGGDWACLGGPHPPSDGFASFCTTRVPSRSNQGSTWMFRISLLIVALMAATTTMAHDRNHPELDGWYSSLRRPSTGHSRQSFTSCCSKTDCHTTDAELRNNEWWARIGVRNRSGDWDLKDWVKIPSEVVLLNHDNPTGEGVICHSATWALDGQHLDPNAVSIWCFVPPSQS
jgi:hypothetical protein